jgi:hypothetical protein
MVTKEAFIDDLANLKGFAKVLQSEIIGKANSAMQKLALLDLKLKEQKLIDDEIKGIKSHPGNINSNLGDNQQWKERMDDIVRNAASVHSEFDVSLNGITEVIKRINSFLSHASKTYKDPATIRNAPVETQYHPNDHMVMANEPVHHALGPKAGHYNPKNPLMNSSLKFPKAGHIPAPTADTKKDIIRAVRISLLPDVKKMIKAEVRKISGNITGQSIIRKITLEEAKTQGLAVRNAKNIVQKVLNKTINKVANKVTLKAAKLVANSKSVQKSALVHSTKLSSKPIIQKVNLLTHQLIKKSDKVKRTEAFNPKFGAASIRGLVHSVLPATAKNLKQKSIISKIKKAIKQKKSTQLKQIVKKVINTATDLKKDALKAKRLAINAKIIAKTYPNNKALQKAKIVAVRNANKAIKKANSALKLARKAQSTLVKAKAGKVNIAKAIKFVKKIENKVDVKTPTMTKKEIKKVVKTMKKIAKAAQIAVHNQELKAVKAIKAANANPGNAQLQKLKDIAIKKAQISEKNAIVALNAAKKANSKIKALIKGKISPAKASKIISSLQNKAVKAVIKATKPKITKKAPAPTAKTLRKILVATIKKATVAKKIAEKAKKNALKAIKNAASKPDSIKAQKKKDIAVAKANAAIIQANIAIKAAKSAKKTVIAVKKGGKITPKVLKNLKRIQAKASVAVNKLNKINSKKTSAKAAVAIKAKKILVNTVNAAKVAKKAAEKAKVKAVQIQKASAQQPKNLILKQKAKIAVAKANSAIKNANTAIKAAAKIKAQVVAISKGKKVSSTIVKSLKNLEKKAINSAKKAIKNKH